VEELMRKGYIRENMGSCVVQVLLILKKHGLEGCVFIVMPSIILW
jgi:hypothetical protein